MNTAMISDLDSVRPLLLKALSLLQEKNIKPTKAIDFGIGSGSETSFLLNNGYQVTAIDNLKEFLTDLTLQERNKPFLNNLKLVETNFETVPWDTLAPVNLFVAFYSLHFINPESFDTIWEQIIAHIRTGGYFVGTVHTHHYRNKQKEGYFVDEPLLVSFRTKERLLDLFQEFNLEYFEDEKILYAETQEYYEGITYSVIARKIN